MGHRSPQAEPSGRVRLGPACSWGAIALCMKRLRGATHRPLLWSLLVACICLLWPAWNGARALALPAPPAASMAGGADFSNETGLPLARHFSAKEYGQGQQNWAIVQDARGMIYIANYSGVLEFDGRRWRLIEVANGSARSLAVASDGRIYVGGNAEIGYLQPDASGQMQYVSLTRWVPEEDRDFADVWNVNVTPHGIVFSSFRRLIRLQGERVESWRASKAFHMTFHVNGRILVNDTGRGLMELAGGELRLLPGGGAFAAKQVQNMMAWAPKTHGAPATILIATFDHGLFVYDGAAAAPLLLEKADELRRQKPYCAVRLADGRLAIGTMRSGLYVFSTEGRMLVHINKARGLTDDRILAMAVDREGGLWLAMGRGVSRLEIGNPVSRFDERGSLSAAVMTVHRHQGHLYVATVMGLDVLEPGPAAHFRRVAGIPDKVWAFLSMGDKLLVGSSTGLYILHEQRSTRLLKLDHPSALLASRVTPGRAYVGYRGGLALLRYGAHGWREEGRIALPRDHIQTFREEPDGRLWAGGAVMDGVLRIRIPARWEPAGAIPAQIERFGVAHGLPGSRDTGIYQGGGQTRFATGAGIYRFSEALQRFEPDPQLAMLFPSPRMVWSLLDDPARGIWLYSKLPNGLEELGLAARQADGSYQWQSQATQALQTSRLEFSQRLHLDANGVLWAATPEGLFRYDQRIAKNYRQPFSALIRGVFDREGRVVSGAAALAFAHANNGLRFEYAAPSFDGLDAMRFQVMLEGNDRQWSDWSSESYRDYSNLFEGSYRLRVRAKNLYGTVSADAVFAFTVLPPWYRTLWAYLAYLVLLIGLAWAGLHWRLLHLQAQKRELETSVAHRTTQLVTLGEVGRATTSTLDLDAALGILLDQMQRVFAASHKSGIGIYHEERGEIDFHLLFDGGQRSRQHALLTDNKDRLATWCIERRQAILIGDLAREASHFAPEPDQMAPPSVDGGAPARSALYVPLLLKGETVGVIFLCSAAAQAFDSSDLELMQTLSAYAATAIGNARAHAALHVSHQQLVGAHRELIDTQQKLVLQEKMVGLGILSAGVAHEINNPNNFAHGAAQVLQLDLQAFESFLNHLIDADADEQMTQAFAHRFSALAAHVNTILDGTQRITTIVKDLRSFTRLGEADKKTVRLSACLHSTLSLARSNWQESVAFTTAFDVDPELECWPALLNQVFMNLLINGCQAIVERQQSGMAPPGQLQIRMRQQGDAVVIEFEDNGVGMSPAVQEHILEPFYTTKTVGEGAGLGLSTAYGIVRKHCGELSFVSTLGVGSRFSVTLPCNGHGNAILASADDGV